MDDHSDGHGGSTSPFSELAEEWRTKAAVLREAGFERAADTYDRHAEQLERAWTEHQNQGLTPTQVSALGGYTPDHIRQLVREGKLPDVSDEDSRQILVPRSAAPRKPLAERSTTGPPSEPSDNEATDRSGRTPVEAMMDEVAGR